MSDTVSQKEIIGEKNTFAEWAKKNDDLIFVKKVKSWIENHDRSIDAVAEFELATDITEDDDKYKRKIAGPYDRIHFTFKDGAEMYGKSFRDSNWDIKEDKKENWGYEWVRQKREVKQ